MTRTVVGYGVVLVAVIVASTLAFTHVSAARAQADSSHIQVRWLLSHQPTEVFDHAVQVFAAELAKQTDGELTLQVVTPEDIGYSKGDVPYSEIIGQIDSGNVQIASAYTVALGKDAESMSALTLPYLFTSYASMNAALDGTIGRQMLDALGSGTSSVRGLAFTMSGGYRILASKNKAISGLSDLKGLRIATSGGSVAQATLASLGATPVSVDLESAAQTFDPNTIDAVETTYSRLAEVLGSGSAYTTYINETDHSMFLTAIVASRSFYDSLSQRDQTALRNAALAAAQIERQDSIALSERVKAQLVAAGSIITAPSVSSTAAMKGATEEVYTKLSPVLGESTVRSLVDSQQ